MKRLFATIVAAFALALAGPLALSGCAGGISGIVAPTPAGVNAKVGVALSTVTEARELLTIAVNADKVSAADATNLREQLNTARAGIDTAQALLKTSPADADARLAVASAAITAVRNYLVTKGAKP